jgi:HD-GYP domain-containing protein (c-di-GMP phosphodiesterase class II)
MLDPGDLHQENSILLHENQKLRQFIEIGKVIGYEHNIDRLFPLIMTQISKFLDADRSTLFLINSESGDLWTKYAEGLSDNAVTIELKVGIVGMCILTEQVVNIANAYEYSRFNPGFDQKTGFRTESVVAVPIRSGDGAVIGAIQFLNKQTGMFSKADEQMIQKSVADFAREEVFGPDIAKERAAAFVGDLRRLLQCERGTLYILEKNQIRSIVTEGVEGMDIRLNTNLGIAGRVAVTGIGMNIPDAYSDPHFDRRTDEKTGYHTRCILCVPIVNQAGEVLGIIQAINKKTGIFTDADMDWLKTLSSMVAISLENALLLAEHDRQFNSILKVMAASIDAKDSLTAGHSEQVEKYALGIAREMGFGEGELDILSVAALLHDYGKIGVDDVVLKKPGKLTSEEFANIRQHVTFTRSILNNMHLARKYQNVPMIAASHHERLDGSGYGCGLKGPDIPFMSKLIAVADVFEALTADRHYRKAMSAEDAFVLLDKEADLQRLDQNIISALKTYWKKTQG